MKKVYNNVVDKEQMKHFTTEYRQNAQNHDLKDSMQAQKLHKYCDQIQPAGVARYLEKSKPNDFITPAEFKHQ